MSQPSKAWKSQVLSRVRIPKLLFLKQKGSMLYFMHKGAHAKRIRRSPTKFSLGKEPKEVFVTVQ